MGEGNPVPRTLPITVIDSDKPAAAEAHDHHAGDANEGPRSLGQPAPCRLFVADTAITEVDIAREMQFHWAMNTAQSRAAAARALVVRDLLRRWVARDRTRAEKGRVVKERERQR